MTDNDIDWQAEWQAVCSMNIRMANGARPFAEQVHEFEACMSDLVAAIGNIERIKSVSRGDKDRLVQQQIRLMNASRDLYIFNGG